MPGLPAPSARSRMSPQAARPPGCSSSRNKPRLRGAQCAHAVHHCSLYLSSVRLNCPLYSPDYQLTHLGTLLVCRGTSCVWKHCPPCFWGAADATGTLGLRIVCPCYNTADIERCTENGAQSTGTWYQDTDIVAPYSVRRLFTDRQAATHHVRPHRTEQYWLVRRG